MITKEEKELIDALSREKGEAMSPFEELTLLGYYENGKAAFINKENNVIEMEIEGVSERLKAFWERINDETSKQVETQLDTPVKNWNRVEIYDFDENDEQYTLLTEVLRYNNNKTKYFA